MNIQIKVLGHRNKVTKAKRSDGQEGYLKGTAGVPGQPLAVDQMWFHARMDPKYKELKEEFHK